MQKRPVDCMVGSLRLQDPLDSALSADNVSSIRTRQEGQHLVERLFKDFIASF